MLLASLVAVMTVNGATDPPAEVNDLVAGHFRWTVGSPLVSPANRPDDPCHAIKDPSIVFYENRWHLFATIRCQQRTHQIEHLSFTGWKDADKAERQVLRICDGYFCAPQVFYFSPHKRWYLIFQTSEPSRKPELQPAFSTATSVSDPGSWSKPTLLFDTHPTNVTRWIDFWVICDESKAHLFFTSLDGRMWRCETKLLDFPKGWTQPSVVLHVDIFEASHTYRLKGLNKFVTLVEAQDGGRRYYKAYLAERLEGEWKPLAATKDKPFASLLNVRDNGSHWTDSISHGELIRSGYDERLEVDPANLRFLFQGVTDEARSGKKYGEIPWTLGILERATALR